ncbi:DUF1272 domain-containing protein [Flavobacterium sp.]|uniref:DUF1272 domain-containing protein n=1 Tax=Flavobacterium sp. TaxID=239 RepID=UPI0028BED7F9|nr:DUF1272 domain-containing protein [Flavobacterium sp.]
MLELRLNCENCGQSLPNDSDQAMICSFECTFCLDCVQNILENTCPNCDGGFEKRPTRPQKLLLKYPSAIELFHKPVDIIAFQKVLREYKNTDPRKR